MKTLSGSHPEAAGNRPISQVQLFFVIIILNLNSSYYVIQKHTFKSLLLPPWTTDRKMKQVILTEFQ